MASDKTDRSHEGVASLVEYGTRRFFVVAGVMLAVLLEILDTTIVNVALPTVQGSIGANLDDAAWIVTGYLIAVIIALPLVPWFESLLGRRRYIVGAILGFTIASAFCGVSQTLEQLVAFRVLQGLCGGGILTMARTILRDTFPPEQIGASQGLLGMGAVVGPSIGPTVGGMLTDAVSWRWVFFINVLPGLMAALLLWLFLREPRRTRVASDTAGIALLAIGLGSLQYVLETGERNDWFGDHRIVTFSIVGAVVLVAFILWELSGSSAPVVDLRILRRRQVAIGSLLSFGIGFTIFAGIVLGPQFSQGILGFTATLSGNQVLIRAVSIAAFIPVAIIAMMRMRIEPRFLIATGFGLVGWSGFLLSGVTTSSSNFWSFGPALSIGGFGFGLLFVPLSVSVLSSVPAHESLKASSMLSIFQQLGSSFSTATLVTVVDRSAAAHFNQLASTIRLGRPPIAALVSPAHAPLARFIAIITREATTLGFADAYIVSGYLGLAMVPLALLLPPPAKTTQAAESPLTSIH